MIKNKSSFKKLKEMGFLPRRWGKRPTGGSLPHQNELSLYYAALFVLS